MNRKDNNQNNNNEEINNQNIQNNVNEVDSIKNVFQIKRKNVNVEQEKLQHDKHKVSRY